MFQQLLVCGSLLLPSCFLTIPSPLTFIFRSGMNAGSLVESPQQSQGGFLLTNPFATSLRFRTMKIKFKKTAARN